MTDIPGLAIKICDDRDTLATCGTAAVADALFALLAEKRSVALAVPGGSTARMVLPRLTALELPWERVGITLTDERWVSQKHPDSNEGLVRSTLAGSACAADFLGLYDAQSPPEDALARLNHSVPYPDVILLGMGEDGHIASLFPHDRSNQATQHFAAVTRPDHPRVTLTPAALQAASAVIVCFAGPVKMATFNRAQLSGRAEELPVRHVLRPGTKLFMTS
jgi:6-phosphogluconolactonase